MKKIVFIAALILAGCASTPTRYNPNNISENDLANITTLQEKGFFNSKYNTWIEFIWDENNVEITKRNAFFSEMLSETSLPAGKYKFKVACTNGVVESHPEDHLEIQGGKHYLLSCEVGKGKNLFGMSVDAYAKIKLKEI